MPQEIPLRAIASQNLSVGLGDQACLLKVYQKNYGLFIDVYVADALVIGGVVCQNLNRIVRSVYLGFQGDLVFFDTQGRTDPVSAGLGDRYRLIYLTQAELDAAGVG